MKEISQYRKPEYPIDPIFIERWSPRSFTGEPIPEPALMTLFEAARWAPSSANSQPWRFIYSFSGSPSFPTFLDFLFEGNRVWCQKASALIIVLSKKTFLWKGKETLMPTRNFDTGAAWQNLALQAIRSGWHTHPMGGFDAQKTRSLLSIPEDYEIQAMVAVGKLSDPADLPQELRERELPNDRRPVKELIMEGTFHD